MKIITVMISAIIKYHNKVDWHKEIFNYFDLYVHVSVTLKLEHRL